MPLILAAGETSVEQLLLIVLIQLSVIILAARAAAIVARWMGQPAVVGEIVAGLLLGPSVLKRLAPGMWEAVFTPHHPTIPTVFEILSQFGLIFLLFLIGLEFDYSHLRKYARSSLMISVAGIALPFALGYGIAVWMHPYLEMVHDSTGILHAVDQRGFALFMGTALSITAIPILGRMMMELNITRTRLGAITITAAAIDDASGWILLATVTALVHATIGGHFDPWATATMIGETVGFFLLMLFVGRPLLSRWIRFSMRRGGGSLGLNALAVLIVIILLCSIVTNVIGIFAIFGAFILGAVLSGEEAFRDEVGRQLRNFITVFFLPIFFTYTGLRTRVDALGSWQMWGFAAVVSAAAIVGKFGGCALAARFNRFSWREASCIGVMMNTRALMGLIAINVGYELHVIPDSVFCMLVLMAIITTVMTTPILLRISAGTDLEEGIASSGFRGKPIVRAPAPEHSDAMA